MVIETKKLIATIKKLYPVQQFFKNRYFPDGKVYYSEKALIETKQKGRVAAPFVIPLVGGIPIEKDGYRAHEVDAPYIAPKLPITASDLEKKAFGEDPQSGRSPADRENEVEAEYIDDLRKSILRRHEQMCTELIMTGKIRMKHFSTAEDAAKDIKYTEKLLRFYEGEFGNIYRFPKEFASMTAKEKIQELYKMSSELRKRQVRATDLVMTSDVSMLFMTDPEFLDFYDKSKVDIGKIKPEELPDGVVYNGGININGVVLSMFTYDDEYEDMDGEVKEMLPKGTIALLHPGAV